MTTHRRFLLGVMRLTGCARLGALDGLFEQIDVGQVKMTGADGLLPALVKEALERGLAAWLERAPGL